MFSKLDDDGHINNQWSLHIDVSFNFQKILIKMEA